MQQDKKEPILSGGKLAGGNPATARVEHDYYATDPEAVRLLLQQYPIRKSRILEPCVGNGNIANAVKDIIGDFADITAVDIVDRGYPNTIVDDFLTHQFERKFDCVISNPPYSLAEDFIRRSFELLEEGGQLMMFLKLQFLEGAKRQSLFEEFPPKYIYVFRKRMATWNNGEPLDPSGKRWATTMCHAWFVWEKGSDTEPIIRWL